MRPIHPAHHRSPSLRLPLAGALSLGVALGACGGTASPPDPLAGDACHAMVADNPRYGGGITVPGGGYCLLTRDGASQPLPGSPVLGSDPTPALIHLGLAADPTSTVVVSWRTRDEATLATTVQYGEGGATDKTAQGFTFTFGDPPVRQHEAHLFGLKPGKVYSYRVGGQDASGKEAWSDVASFHTAPAPPPGPGGGGPVTFLLIGDTRDDAGTYAVWGAMTRAAQQGLSPDLILFSGDAITLGNIQSEWDGFFAAAEPVLRTVPMIVAHGNHEASQVNYYSQFALPGDKEYYSLDYGPAHIAVLNDTPQIPTDYMTIGTPFLDHDLAAHQGAAWKLVLHHKPPYSAGTTHGSELTLRAAWGPLVDKYKVDLVLNGHDHDYQRSKPMRGAVAQARPTDGTTYVVAGSAGAPLYDLDLGSADFIAVAKKSFSYVGLKLRPGMPGSPGVPDLPATVEMKAYDDLGTVIDSLSYQK